MPTWLAVCCGGNLFHTPKPPAAGPRQLPVLSPSPAAMTTACGHAPLSAGKTTVRNLNQKPRLPSDGVLSLQTIFYFALTVFSVINSDVQFGQRMAFSGISVQQYGQVLVVLTISLASCRSIFSLKVLMALIKTNTANATIKKLMTAFKNRHSA